MSASIVIRCDAFTGRGRPCTRSVATGTTDVDEARRALYRQGWTVGGRLGSDFCPSCKQRVSRPLLEVLGDG